MCSGECYVCACGGFCLAGHNDDYFVPANKEKVIENLDNNRYERYREYMIKYLKEKFNYDYIKNNESEEKSILHNVNIKHKENKVLEEFWVIRAMKKDFKSGFTSSSYGFSAQIGALIIKEQELNHEPTPNEIAQFLYESHADFVSVVQNYRFANELPFC